MAGPLVAAAVPAVGSVIGGVISNLQNRGMAREQMRFQRDMSNTAYQRAMRDMRLSGLNPMLAYMQGGASSPSGSTATMNDIVGPAVSSAQHGRRLSGEVAAMRASTAKMENEAMVLQQERQDPPGPGIGRSNWQLLRDAQVRLLDAQTSSARSQSLLNAAQLPGARVTGSTVGGIARLIFGGGGVGSIVPQVRRFNTFVNPIRRP